MKFSMRLPTALAFLVLAPMAQAGFVYDDGVAGNDLSNVGTTPSALVLGTGSNFLNGTTGGGDRDYVTLTLPTGNLLTALYVRPGTTVAGTSSFIGVQAGDQVTVDPGTSSAAGLLGWHLYSPANIDEDILPLMGAAGNGATGFAPPLASGDYTFWIQELGGVTRNYRFEFVVTPVPEPSSVVLMLAGLAVLTGAALRRRSS